jgi:hypothetical protein
VRPRLGRLDRAWERLVTERRAACLREQVEALRFADGIRTFCAELRSAPTVAGGEGVRLWLTWAEGYADEIDPRLHPPAVPDDPSPDYDSMAPHIDGDWSAYERRRRWREWRLRSDIGRRFPDPDEIYDE